MSDGMEDTGAGRVGPGRGRAQLKDHVAQRLGVLRGLGRFLQAHTDDEGALRCPRHGVEHTGWGAAGAHLHLASYRYTREPEHLERARRAVLRAVDQVGVDPGLDGGAGGRCAEVFLPGAADPASGLEHAVESGACAEALATLLRVEPGAFTESDAERGREALTRVVESRLAGSARDEAGSTARMWAALGTAAAARLLGREDWRQAARDGCLRLLDEMSDEGVVPLQTGADPRAVSGAEQSRALALLLAVHAELESPLQGRARDRLALGLDVLVALRDGRGRKRLEGDPRRAHWGGRYEVASHPFDAYALWVGARLLGSDTLARDAGAAMEEWQAHLSALDGGVESHHGPSGGRGTRPARSPECRLGWSAHGAFVARVIEDVELFARHGQAVDVALPRTGLLHVERPRYTAVLRGGRLLSLVVRDDPRVAAGVERVEDAAAGSAPPGCVEVRPGGGGLAGLWGRGRRGRSDRTGADDAWVWDGTTACFRGGVADADGRSLESVGTEERYTFGEDRVGLEQGVSGTGAVRCAVDLPAAFELSHVESRGGRHARRGRRVRFRGAGGPWSLTLRGCWPA